MKKLSITNQVYKALNGAKLVYQCDKQKNLSLSDVVKIMLNETGNLYRE